MNGDRPAPGERPAPGDRAAPDPADREELVTPAEQEEDALTGGTTEGATQRREADRVQDHREGGPDPLSGSGTTTHERSRRGRQDPGRP
jgi:hypothetical protein